jgi:hypothetical protein
MGNLSTNRDILLGWLLEILVKENPEQNQHHQQE